MGTHISGSGSTIQKFLSPTPVSSEISDFMPGAHAQSNILHIKYAEKNDD